MALKMTETPTRSSKESLLLMIKLKKSYMAVNHNITTNPQKRQSQKVNKILSDVREKMISLKLGTMNSSNIMNELLGRRGLSLNQNSNARFAQNLIDKLRYVVNCSSLKLSRTLTFIVLQRNQRKSVHKMRV